MRDLSLRTEKIAICRENLRKSQFGAETVKNRDLLTGDTRKIFVSNIKTVDESHSACVLIGCKPISDLSRRKKSRFSTCRDFLLSLNF